MTEENLFGGGASRPAISFAQTDQYGQKTSVPPGTEFGGEVVEEPKLVQKRDYQTKEPVYWPDGAPRMEIVTAIKCDHDGVERSLWCGKPSQMMTAINEAIQAAGAPAIVKGGKLYVKLVGFQQGEDKNKNPAKTYEARYTPPNLMAAPAPAAPATAAPPPPAAPAAPPAAEPKLSNGFTATQLRAAGWTEEQIAALGAPAPAPAAPPAPPAPAPAPAASGMSPEQQAAIDALTPEQRALLGV